MRITLFSDIHANLSALQAFFADVKQKDPDAINIGSVGKPKAGDPHGCYVMLTINENSGVTDQTSIHAEFVRFNYDIEKAATAV